MKSRCNSLTRIFKLWFQVLLGARAFVQSSRTRGCCAFRSQVTSGSTPSRTDFHHRCFLSKWNLETTSVFFWHVWAAPDVVSHITSLFSRCCASCFTPASVCSLLPPAPWSVPLVCLRVPSASTTTPLVPPGGSRCSPSQAGETHSHRCSELVLVVSCLSVLRHSE